MKTRYNNPRSVKSRGQVLKKTAAGEEGTEEQKPPETRVGNAFFGKSNRRRAVGTREMQSREMPLTIGRDNVGFLRD